MGLGERAAARKRAKELKSELKDLRRALTAAGGDKAQAAVRVKELQEALELGGMLCETYEEARRHMEHARADVDELLACMDSCTAGETKERLRSLVDELSQVCHECLIREGDLDFKSTLEGLSKLAQGSLKTTAGMEGIMLRSELENVRAVLADAAAWSAPDFFALAFYDLHEDREALGEMENEQRNARVLSYRKEHFEDTFLQECERAGAKQQVKELIAAYTGGK